MKCRSILKQALAKINDKTFFTNEFHINNISFSGRKEIAESSTKISFADRDDVSINHNIPPSKNHFSSFLSLDYELIRLLTNFIQCHKYGY